MDLRGFRNKYLLRLDRGVRKTLFQNFAQRRGASPSRERTEAIRPLRNAVSQTFVNGENSTRRRSVLTTLKEAHGGVQNNV